MEPAEQRLDSFNPADRLKALRSLAGHKAVPPAGENVNMHIHSFFSFNARGYSPAHIAWAARTAGLYAAGLCDFDVLDGLEEFLAAGAILGLRTTVNLETRAYLAEFGQADINSPGEPGVTYVMGGGFGHLPAAGSPEAEGLQAFRHQARQRNEALIRRINAALPTIAIAYESDVLPLTPAGAATERHIVRAYIHKAIEVFQHAEATARFWGNLLGRSFEDTVALLADSPAMEEAVRTKLVKRGGIGYEPPSPHTFPPVDRFMRWVLSCGAIPMTTWLDGTSEGESDPVRMLECMDAKGAAALNIIPDRNWNIRDPQTRRVKIAKLAEIVAAAEKMHLPINIGTEMNRDGQPFFDDLAGPALQPHKAAFLKGARILVGHTLTLRYAHFSYAGPEAAAEFGSRAAKNAFFESVGALPPLTESLAARLADAGPRQAWPVFRDSAARGQWTLA